MDQDQPRVAARLRQLANIALVVDMANFPRPGEVRRILPYLAEDVGGEVLEMDGYALPSQARDSDTMKERGLQEKYAWER